MVVSQLQTSYLLKEQTSAPSFASAVSCHFYFLFLLSMSRQGVQLILIATSRTTLDINYVYTL